jgi:hypothetical protein
MDRMLLVLKRSPEQETALQALLDQQHDKSSGNYHRWLTPDEFGQQFGPADQDIQAITSWLQSHGFQVARVGRGRTAIEFSGTAAQVREAFHTQIRGYLASGEQHWANATDPQIPAALASGVVGVVSLHNFSSTPMHHVAGLFSKEQATGRVTPLFSGVNSSPANSSQARPQFTFTDSQCQPACYAVAPGDFATIYNVLPLWNANPAIDGSGESIAIVGRSNIDILDVRGFRRLFGLPANDPTILLDGPDPGIRPGDETESDLDVEWAGAVAPHAAIKFVVSASTNTDDGIVLSAIYAIDNNVAPVLSVSYGQCELHLGTAGNQFFNLLWEQAAAQGITVMVSTGDSGSAVCDRFSGLAPQSAKLGLAVSGLASTPFNVAVGGTDFLNFGPNFSINSPSPYWNATNGANLVSAKGYVPESTWNNSCTNEGLSFLGFESNAEARCNDSQLKGLVVTVAGSGGKSNCISSDGVDQPTCASGYPSPAWQTTGLNDTTRDLPDLSLFASDGLLWNSFYVVCEADATPGASCLPGGSTSFIGVGGTSAAAPAFAGMMALVNQFTNSAGQGNANYVLYKLPSLSSQQGLNCDAKNTPNSACIFNDVTFGTNAVPCGAGTPNCTPSIASDLVGVLPGYSASTGYDLATGLGSVNANNLVRNWNQVTFNSTSTTLTLNSGNGNIVHGQPVPVSVTVTGNGGTPTGDISLIASSVNGEGVDSHALSNGTASWQTSLLPGGNYAVQAHYPGDGTFGGSNSAPFQVNVSPENSTTTLSCLTPGPTRGLVACSSRPGPYQYGGVLLYLRADVAPGTNNSEDSSPTGSVTFTDSFSSGGIPGSPFLLNSQGYTATPHGVITFAPGQHSISASYSGDNSYHASNSTSSINFTIVPDGTLTKVQAGQSEVPLGSPLTLTANISTGVGVNVLTGMYGGAALPTGTVTFFLAGTALGPAVPVTGSITPTQMTQGSATATYPTGQFPLGEDGITVQYSGDTNYSGSTSQALLVHVGYGTSTTLTSSNPAVPISTNVTFTAQVTSPQSGGPAITGNVLFQIDGSGGTTIPLVNGTAQFTTSFASPTPSSHQIVATYSGDNNYVSSHGIFQEGILTPDFTLSESISNLTIAAPGQSSAPITLTIAGTNGYNGTIAFTPASCVITPAGSLSTCSFSPSSITGSGSAQVVINTTAPHASAIPTNRFGLDGTKPQPIAVCLILLIVLAAFTKRGRFRLAFSCLILMTLLSVWSCGGASGGAGGGSGATPLTIPGTPTGVPYTVSINASAPGISSHTTGFTFIVQ